MLAVRFLRLMMSAGAGFLALSLAAQNSSIATRIRGPIDENSLTTLQGNVTPMARLENDRGEASPGTPLHMMRLVLSRSEAQTEALNTLMAEQLDKSSPNYHKWLTPEEFGHRFGPADSDIAAITAWLESHGLKVEDVPSGRTNIAFSGTAGQVEEAFHTSIHSFEANGVQFYSNTSDPKIPSALAAVVSGVAHLNTLEARPHKAASQSGSFDPEAHRFAALRGREPEATPQFTTGGGFLWLVPADAATIYNTQNAYNAAFTSGTSYTGKGVTIGIGGDAAVKATTVVNYRTRFLNGDTTAPTITNVNNSAVTGANTDEAYIDVELSGGLAPGAALHFYTASDLGTAVQQAVSDNKVDIFSLSFGSCEYQLTTSDNQFIAGLWQQANTQGIAVTVSTGDSGSAGCDSDSATVATGGLQVNGWASTVYNIAVGGTDFYALGNNFSTYVNNNSSSQNYYRSALKYIPESTWNDSTTADGLLANNTPSGAPSNTNIVGGSGGVSACSTNTDSVNGSTFVPGTCSHGYAKPTWQRGTGVPNDGARDLPDVSMFAGNGNDGATWLVCTDDAASGTSFNDDCADHSGNFYYTGFGGTSTAAPAFAGVLATVQEMLGGTGHRLGADAAKTLYDIFNGAAGSAVFHDVTVGNNSVYCTSGSPNCKTNTAGFPFLTGYDTTAGYDLATGLGSVDATQLIKNWNASTGTGSATVTVTPSASQITTAQTLTVAVTVAGSGTLGTPSGTVTLSGGGYTSGAQTLSAGAASFTIAAGALAAGTDKLTATYSGDSNYATTTGTATVTVTGTLLTPMVTVTPASGTIDSSQSLAVTVVVAGTGATPTGTVTLSGGGYTSPATTLASGSATITIPGSSLASGSVTLSASYSGDANYTAGSGTASITVTQSVFAMSASTPSPVSAGGTATSTVTVSTSTGYAGSIALTCALTSSPSGAVNLPGCTMSGSPVTLSSSASSATATASISTTAAVAKLDHRGLPGFVGGAGGAVLALVFFAGLPARRRSWRSLLGLMLLMVALGGMSACGSSSGTNGGGGSPGTTAGSYTFTVTGTGTPAVSPAPTTTFTVTVN